MYGPAAFTEDVSSSHTNEGVIPRVCDAVFERLAAGIHADATVSVSASQFVIYRQRAHDIGGEALGTELRLRRDAGHPDRPYFEGITSTEVTSAAQLRVCAAAVDLTSVANVRL